MASHIQAVQTYGPHLIRGETVQQRELLKLLSTRTGLKESEVLAVLSEMRDAIIFYSRTGRGVKLYGMGTYLPYVKLDGSIRVSYRLNPELRYEINSTRDFRGEILNCANIGKTVAELIELWN